jgi:GNAT superfamily N-acetyltransferase
LIQWKSLEKKEPSKIKRLWDLSKQGVWNHLNLTDHTSSALKNDWLRFISLNPNIAHSYKNSFGNGSDGKSDLNGMDHSLRAYSGVKQLPGEPFWKFLSDPAHLLLYLKQHGKKNLFCLRADRINETLISLGSSITFNFMKPDELPQGFLDEICVMVEAGGSVDKEYVRYNLERAYLIGYAEENGIIVGNSSLKHPREEFIQRLNTITGLNFNHFVERGYTSVRPEYRALGVGARLLEGLTKRAGQYKIFSIISEDNTATQKIARKNKTKQIAVYYSEKIGKKLGIWMPEHMIEKDWEIKL